MSRLKKALFWSLGALVTMSIPVMADLTVLDGTGATKTIFGYVCFTTKLCNATALVNSAGTEIATSGNPVRTDPTGTTPQPVTGTFWQATQPISGTVTANLGTLNGAATAAAQTTGNASLSSIDGKTPALGQALAAASVPVILPAATITTLTPPTTVTVTQSTASNLNATVVGTGTFAVQANPGTAANWGLGATGAAVPANASLGAMSQGGNLTAFTGTSGNLNVQCANCSGSGVSTADQATFTAGSSLFAGAGGFFQTTATSNPLTTGQQGLFQVTAQRALFTNLRNASGTEVGTSAAELFVGGRGTAGSAAGGVLTVQGVASMTPLLSNPGTAALWGVNTLGSTTSGQSGQLSLGAVTTAAPTYTTAQSNAISLTTAGDLRTVFSNSTIAVTQGTASNLNATVVGTGTFVTQSTLAAETTKVIGTVRNLGNAGAITDFAGQNAASPANSWLIGGQFNTTPTTITSGNSSPLQLDNAGNLLVNIKAGASSGAVAQGSTTSGQTGVMVQSATTSSAPTYTTATTNPLSTDTSGNLRVTVTGAVGLAQGSTTSGQTGSMIMGAVTTSAPTYTTAQTSPLSLDTAGGLRVNCATGCSAGAISNASSGVTTTSTNSGVVGYNYGFNGTTWDQLQVDASKNLKVLAVGAGTAGTASGGVLTVQGVASMTPFLANPGTAANWGVQTQGSTTSGQSGELNLAAVLSAAPTYTTAQTSPLNMTTGGGLRIDNASVAGTAMLTGNGTTAAGSQRVTIASDSAARAVAGEGTLGSTAPTGAQMSGVQSGANMVAMLQASASVAINVATATTTQLVALSGSTKVYVTSFDVIAGGTGNITFVYGTGTNCGTGQTALTGAYNLTAQAGIAKGSGMGPVLVVPAGNALCVLTSAAVQMSGSVSYTQF